MTAYRCLAIVVGGFVATAGCRNDHEVPPFTATPAPATWQRPEIPAVAAPEATDRPPADKRLRGDGTWPCSRPEPSACDDRAPTDGTLGTNAASIEFLDPTLASETEGMTVAMNLFEGLVGPARASGLPLEQGVATHHTVSSDQRTYTFHLRSDARWSNGRTVVARDFVYAWTRKLAPETASRAAESLYWIDGAEAFNRGENRDPGSLGLEIVDDHTLRVRLRCPYPFWLEELANGHWLPVPEEAIAAHGHAWMRTENIVTNGPFHLAEWLERDRIVLTRSDTYWDAANVRIPKVVFYQTENEDRPRNLFKTNQIQWARGAVTPAEIGPYIAANAPEFLLEPRLCVYFYAFRTDRPPFDDARVRRAIDMAIDKERLVTHVARGFQVPASGPVPPAISDTLGYRRLEGPGFDPEAARQLLAEAGFPRGQGLPPFRISYNTMDAHKIIAEFVQRSLAENLGVEVTLENLEWKSLLKKIDAGDFHMTRYGWCGSATPASFLELFSSDSPRNITAWKNEAFDALVRESRCAESSEASMIAAAKAEDLLVAAMPIAPIYHYTLPYLKKPVLQGLRPHLADLHPVKYMFWADTQSAPAEHPWPSR